MAYDILAMLNDIRDAVAVGKRRGGIALSAWEEEFIESIEEQLDDGRALTEKQSEALRRIWDRI